MIEIPENLGNAVKIRDTIIPAVNIQTEITDEYDLYFEVLFENGALWIVYREDEGRILWVDVYHDWANREVDPHFDLNPDNKRAYKDWEMFLFNYNKMLRVVVRQDTQRAIMAAPHAAGG